MAAAPVRSASAAWAAIVDLVADTVAQSSSLDRDQAMQTMTAADGVGRMLVAGGHLQDHPITLVAGLVHCEITTVSGAGALTMDENLNPVLGAAGAEDFTVYLPSPDPLRAQVRTAVKKNSRLSDDPAPAPSSEASRSGPLVDREALQKAVAQR